MGNKDTLEAAHCFLPARPVAFWSFQSRTEPFERFRTRKERSSG